MKKFMTMLCLAALAMLGFQAMGQTIYITKTSVGNIWAWDASGDYFSGWPGPAINTLETATVNGTEYYTFTYTHENRANAGLVFNENGAPQTGNLEPQDGKLYNYTGGTTVEVTDFEGNVEPVEESLALRGSFNDWGMTAMTKGEDGMWTITQAMEAGAEFKFYNENAQWIGGEANGKFVVTQEQVAEGTELALAIPGNNFQIPVEGEWTLTVNRDSMNVVIAGEWVDPIVEPATVYILGEVNNNGGWFANVGTEMATEDGITYTATITTLGENKAEDEEIGYSYFSFTTELAEDNDEGAWDYIAPYRFGAVSEGDFLVTNEQLGNAISLTKENGQALKIEAGMYKLTLNLAEMTLVIKKSAANGDVTGDGHVDVDDLNMVINMILELSPKDLNADLNGDGLVDIDDVNAIINMILSE